LLVEALARAGARRSALHLTLVGDGEMRGAVEAAIRAHGLEGRVTITGWVDEDRVRAELAAAHAWCCRASPKACRWS
jgi:glycosyltransferase involved in cell wall biosynthesis